MARSNGSTGRPHGGMELTSLSDAVREKLRRLVLVSATESDAEIAAKMKPPIEAHYVHAMRERLEGLGVIAKAEPAHRLPRKPKPSDNFDLPLDVAP